MSKRDKAPLPPHTGRPPGLLQDDCRKLSIWLSNQPSARRIVRENCAAIANATGDKT